ncbi:Twin-arginine translocation pathway signal [Novosphingobium aromaticivorans DSM 12444]|uniref:Twin-arginine translocation pathway signal n=1 Tax=Novosphingobium aromaticivorans (strain ATCC 700278 / DSM 12444 / CCUG 56034 / CIP 105152 / NBRC 16084 / F199) TaxID=279238 RepID=Q2G888_NOVAD|nr:hypothetical protein [Novosphingobium aromaticivorans]ABD25935.1 Twin-arginine translocation pathway signal [Novosphingobium aromaticivorans DSM 12444]SCY97925.1 hypothetical protein SAMN05660666_04046 [Novosphingobium aromaticivorans]
MPDRRQVMVGGLLGCALVALPAKAAQIMHIGDTAVLVGNGFPDRAHFLGGCDRLGQATACGGAIATLATDRFDAPRVIALAQQSEAFPLQQLLREAGYRQMFNASHFRTEGRVEHRLDGEAALVKAVASAISRTGANWASALALHLLTRSPSVPRFHSSLELETPAHAGPAFLNSFLFERLSA